MKVEAVTATTADGVTLRGEVVRGGPTWAVLVHDVGEDIDVWKRLRAGLTARGWGALALDLRGHGGSDGSEEWVSGGAGPDVDLGVALARRFGAQHVAVIAIGRSAVVALAAAERALADERLDLADSLVLVSPGPLEAADPEAFRAAGLPKLYLYGAKDPAAADAHELWRASIGWTIEATFATEAHGTALLEEWPAQVLDKAAGFVHDQAARGGLGRARFERRLESA